MVLEENTPKWYVGYTVPNCERKVESRVNGKGFDSYVPLQKIVRQWSDRKKKLDIPLFPNYIFVRSESLKRLRELSGIPELLKFISFDGKLANVASQEIDAIRFFLASGCDVQREQRLTEGELVRIVRGQFAGLEGTLLKANGRNKFVIQLHSLQQGISVYIDGDIIEPVKKRPARAIESPVFTTENYCLRH